MEEFKKKVEALEKGMLGIGVEVNATRLEVKALGGKFDDATRAMRQEFAGMKESIRVLQESMLRFYQADPRFNHEPVPPSYPERRSYPQDAMQAPPPTYRTPSRGVVVPVMQVQPPVVYETAEGEEMTVAYPGMPPMRPREDSSVSIRAAGMGLRLRGPDAYKALAVLVLTGLALMTGYVLRANAHPTKTLESTHETQVTK